MIQQTKSKVNWIDNIFSKLGHAAAMGCFLFLWDMNGFKIKTTEIDTRQDIDIISNARDTKDQGNRIIYLEARLPDETKIKKSR